MIFRAQARVVDTMFINTSPLLSSNILQPPDSITCWGEEE